MDDLTQSWNRLTLSDREGPSCCLLDDDSSQKFSIAALFLTRRAISMEVIARRLTHYGEPRMVSRFRVLETTNFFSSLITRRMWIEF